MVRIPERHDWVAIVLLGCILLYVAVLQQLQREGSMREFILNNFEESSNKFPAWIIVSVVNVVLLAALLSSYVPIVPRAINNFSVFGLSLNKFGYTFWVLSLFYIIKIGFTYLYYLFLGQEKRFSKLYFISSKYYFFFTVLLMAGVFARYYLPAAGLIGFRICLLSLAVVFIAKNMFYLLHRSGALPREWYYKFLYICTLQIAPVMALWQLLFF